MGSGKSLLNSFVALLLIAILIFFAATLSSSTIPVNRADAFSLSTHRDITRGTLDFLHPYVLDAIMVGHYYSDITHRQVSAGFHFDSCSFREGTQGINTRYDRVIFGIGTPGPYLILAAQDFGKILHSAQDFYTHSNWVEMGRRDLLDDSKTSKWTVLTPMSFTKHGIFVIQGEEEDIPAGYTLTRAPGDKRVSVTTSGGAVYPGLITGNIWYWTDDCPDNITLGHWDSNNGPGLNKDKPERPGYITAVDLAKKQTLNEWCRLVNLVQSAHGDA